MIRLAFVTGFLGSGKTTFLQQLVRRHRQRRTVAGQMLRESQLDRLYKLSAVVAVVGAGTLRKLLHTLPSLRAQIEAASLVLLNKTDLYSSALVEETEVTIREIHPAVSIQRTSYCTTEVDVFGTWPPLATNGELAA